MKHFWHLVVWGVLCVVSSARAAEVTIGITNPLGDRDLSEVVAGIVTGFLVPISIPIVAIMVIYGAFQIMTAGGDPNKFSEGRKTITYAAIGFAIVLLAQFVAEAIKEVVGVS